jgi:D-alanyl-D-alanine carboxypeptidase
VICAPGTCFHYAHTNYVILDRVIRRVTGRPTGRVIRERVLKPLGAKRTAVSALPAIPAPTLHSYVAYRGPYEDSTFWSPSWTIAPSTVMTATIGDVIKAAKAFGTGALISRRASRERFAPTTAGLEPFSPEAYYGLGILIRNGWEFQNPELNGYTAIAAYLPSRRISLALTTTSGPAAAATEANYSQKLFASLAAYLTPNRPAG